MNICPKCGARINTGVNRCFVCGYRPEPTLVKDIPKAQGTKKYCDTCGGTLPSPGAACPKCSTASAVASGVATQGGSGEKHAPRVVGKKKRKGWIFLFLLPAVLLGAYIFLLSRGLQEIEIPLPFVDTAIEFLDLSDTVFLKVAAILSFFVCPIIFLVLLISFSGRTYDEEEYEPIAEEKEELPDQRVMNTDGFRSASAPARAAEKTVTVTYPRLEGLEKEYAYINRAKRNAGEKNDDRISLSELAEDLVGFAASKGVKMTPGMCAEIIAAMASDRLIIAEGGEGDEDISEDVFCAVSEYFGGKVSPFKAPENCKEAYELSRDSEGKESDFLADLYTACLDKDNIRFAFLSQVDPAEAKNYLSEYVSAIHHRSLASFATVEKSRSGNKLLHLEQGKVTLAKNLRLVITPLYDQDSTVIADERIILDLSGATACERTEYERKIKRVSAYQFNDAARIMRETKYLSEDTWKKLDELFIYLGNKFGCVFGNRDIRIMETYSSAYMAVGGGAGEALDSMLASCIMRALYEKRVVPTVSENEENLVQRLERLFGSDVVPVSTQIARRLLGSGGARQSAEKAESDTAPEAAPTIQPEANTAATETAVAADETVVETVTSEADKETAAATEENRSEEASAPEGAETAEQTYTQDTADGSAEDGNTEQSLADGSDET